VREKADDGISESQVTIKEWCPGSTASLSAPTAWRVKQTMKTCKRTRKWLGSSWWYRIGGLVTVVLGVLQLRVVHQHTLSSQVVNKPTGGIEGLLSKRHYSGNSANARSLSIVMAVKAPEETAAPAEPKASAAADPKMKTVRNK
jgi:hypothetical protein